MILRDRTAIVSSSLKNEPPVVVGKRELRIELNRLPVLCDRVVLFPLCVNQLVAGVA